MTGGPMFSFRVADTRIARLLFAMPDRSDFIRQTVIEKLRAGQDRDDPRPAPEVIARDAGVSEADQILRLRHGLLAIANSAAATLDAGGGEDVPDLSPEQQIPLKMDSGWQQLYGKRCADPTFRLRILSVIPYTR